MICDLHCHESPVSCNWVANLLFYWRRDVFGSFTAIDIHSLFFAAVHSGIDLTLLLKKTNFFLQINKLIYGFLFLSFELCHHFASQITKSQNICHLRPAERVFFFFSTLQFPLQTLKLISKDETGPIQRAADELIALVGNDLNKWCPSGSS